MKNLKVLVAGGAGYISQVALDSARQGHEPVILDNLYKGHREAARWGKFVEGDIGQSDLVTELIAKEKIEAVIHLAAHSLVGESVHNPPNTSE